MNQKESDLSRNGFGQIDYFFLNVSNPEGRKKYKQESKTSKIIRFSFPKLNVEADKKPTRLTFLFNHKEKTYSYLSRMFCGATDIVVFFYIVRIFSDFHRISLNINQCMVVLKSPAHHCRMLSIVLNYLRLKCFSIISQNLRDIFHLHSLNIFKNNSKIQ